MSSYKRIKWDRRDFLLGVAALMITPCSPVWSFAPTDTARVTLRRATEYICSLATEGGYLWWYSEDLKERGGENKANPSQVWVQPPGTPAMGMAFLRAHEVTNDLSYLQAAQGAASALAAGQLQSGGWDYAIDFDPQESKKWYRRTDAARLLAEKALGRRNTSTFDDDNSQSALRFLSSFLDATKKGNHEGLDNIRAARDHGLTKMLEAQYLNGAWPQRYEGRRPDPAQYPVRSATVPERYPREHSAQDYSHHYTLNDDTQRDCIRTLLDAYHRQGKQEYLRAAKRGGDFLILSQLPTPQSAWAQQYNTAMEPAWARAFEPPAVSSRESAGAVRTLVEIYQETGEKKYLDPISAALAWLERSQLAPNRWARFYELRTNKPIYGDRDGKIHDTLEELSEERRNGYAWQGSFGVASAIAVYQEALKIGSRRARETVAIVPVSKARLAALELAATRVIAALDSRGRWLTKGRIETRVYIENARALCDYIEAAEK